MEKDVALKIESLKKILSIEGYLDLYVNIIEKTDRLFDINDELTQKGEYSEARQVSKERYNLIVELQKLEDKYVSMCSMEEMEEALKKYTALVRETKNSENRDEYEIYSKKLIAIKYMIERKKSMEEHIKKYFNF